MKAAVRDRYGGPEVVRVEEVERPTPVDDQVLVRIKAASVNRGDLDGLYPRWWFIRLFSGVRTPNKRTRRVGIDVAGEVEAVGPEVKELKVGDAVFGELSGFGTDGFADYTSTPERAFAIVPAGVSYEDASALPHSATLAVRALEPRGGQEVVRGMRVLIVGASGNVGPFAIQIAKSMGAHVTGVASGDKLDFVRSVGADDAIDYRTTDYTRPARPYDRVIDVNSHHSLLRWRAALKPGGVYLSLAGSTWWLLSSVIIGPFVRRLSGKHMGLAVVPPFRPEDRQRIRELVEAGVLKPVIDKRYALDDVGEALRWVDEGKARGKVLVIP